MINDNQETIKVSNNPNEQIELLEVHKKLKQHEMKIASLLGVVLTPNNKLISD
jgi:hypothetical protein